MKKGVLTLFLITHFFFAGCTGKVVAKTADPEAAPPPHGAPAAPESSKVVQPDGTVVTVVLRGDEWKNWVETIEGYTIAKGKDGYWYYVTGYEGKVPILSGIKANETIREGLERHIRPQ